jgi:hypothetical protein
MRSGAHTGEAHPSDKFVTFLLARITREGSPPKPIIFFQIGLEVRIF